MLNLLQRFAPVQPQLYIHPGDVGWLDADWGQLMMSAAAWSSFVCEGHPPVDTRKGQTQAVATNLYAVALQPVLTPNTSNTAARLTQKYNERDKSDSGVGGVVGQVVCRTFPPDCGQKSRLGCFKLCYVSKLIQIVLQTQQKTIFHSFSHKDGLHQKEEDQELVCDWLDSL